MGREREADQAATVAALLRAAGARFAFVHGSRALGTDRDGSDLDVAAWWGDDPPPPWQVDLPDGVDLLVLDGAPLELAGRVALGGRAPLRRRPPGPGRWQAQTRLVFLDEEDRQRGLDRLFFANGQVVDERRVRRLLQRVGEDLAYLRGTVHVDRSTLVATPTGSPPSSTCSSPPSRAASTWPSTSAPPKDGALLRRTPTPSGSSGVMACSLRTWPR